MLYNKSLLIDPIVLDKDIDKNFMLEQYKLLINSINNTHDIREKSNTLWQTINSLGLGSIAYIKDSPSITMNHKTYIVWALCFTGSILCLSWINFLFTIKCSIGVKNHILLELEQHFPAKVFTRVFQLSDEKKDTSSFTWKEMLFPCLFILGYITVAIILYIFPEDIVKSS